MKICGIIVEYNPFHYGHVYHIQQARKKTNCDILIAVMSGHFTQRGEPAIINKWERTQYALKYGIDIVIELPFLYACQSADYFAYASIFLLNELGVDTIVFGSESNDIPTLECIAKTIQNNKDAYNELVKNYTREGISYATACNKAIYQLTNQQVQLPNDILAFSYIKEIMINHYPITPIGIKRTNQFHSTNLETKISSATSIRRAIYHNIDVLKHTPMALELTKNPVFIDQFYDLLYYKLTIHHDLSSIHLVNEGIEQLLRKNIQKANSIEQLIELTCTKRYTASRIRRTIIFILLHHSFGLIPIDYIRILGMNHNGQQYINSIKKKCTIPIISNYKNICSPLLDLEMQATKLYACIFPIPLRNTIIEMEYKNPPIIIK